MHVWAKSTPEEKAVLQKVQGHFDQWDKGLGSDFRERSNRFYSLYRGFSRDRNAWERAGPNDKDGVIYDAKKRWGANLHIPLTFSTVEQMCALAAAHRPRMLILPRTPDSEENVEPMRLTIDAQQSQIDYELVLEEVMRTAFIYGLGWQKTYWKKKYAPRRRVKRRVFSRLTGSDEYQLGRLEYECVFDDPMAEALDIFDVMWDPAGYSVDTCGWMIHRMWMSLPQVLRRFQDGTWTNGTAKALTEQDIRSMGGGQEFDTIWADRMEASGFKSAANMRRGEQLHEVWEWHDGHRVVTVLDRQVIVHAGENPCVGELPFQAFRPTPLPKQMVGIGEVEPSEHLQRELDTMRSQRRDAATLALLGGYAYDTGAVDEDDLVFGPAAAIGVDGDPRAALMPLAIKDVPGSAYNEEQTIKADWDRVTGGTEALQGQGGTVGTATEAQLLQASISVRVQRKARRAEVEVIRPAARCFGRMNQRMILEPRQYRDQPVEEEGQHKGRYTWFVTGPSQLRGEFDYEPEGGSTQAENKMERMQKAVQLLQIFGQAPFIKQERVFREAIRLFDLPNPDSWLQDPRAALDPAVLEILSKRLGVRDDLIQLAVETAQQENPQIASPDQVTEAQGQEPGIQEAA